jgi:hypothetical protein
MNKKNVGEVVNSMHLKLIACSIRIVIQYSPHNTIFMPPFKSRYLFPVFILTALS